MRASERRFGKNVICMLNAADGTYGSRCQWHDAVAELDDGIMLTASAVLLHTQFLPCDTYLHTLISLPFSNLSTG